MIEFESKFELLNSDLISLDFGGDGLWKKGMDGVECILTPKDGKVEFIVFENKTLVYVKSLIGHPAIYPLEKAEFEGPAEAVLMDLDGTSVKSEAFWIWIIQRTMAHLMGKQNFILESEDEPHVSGNSISEHLQYCLNKYCPKESIENARNLYYRITKYEMDEILVGRGKKGAFVPCDGLKDFLYALKDNDVKIGLVTSGLYEKAWPEILSAFDELNMGNPLDLYDVVITAGHALKKGQAGTLGELAAKPHPWLYAETARVGLGMNASRKNKVIGLEDSSAGVVSLRLAGFSAIGVAGGNIESSGVKFLLCDYANNLMNALPYILGM